MRHIFIHNFQEGRKTLVFDDITNLKATADKINSLGMTGSEEVIDWRVEILNILFNSLPPKKAGKLIELLK